ncbi:MAG: penicillin-binding protein activator [Proteobacteria bacterium]|nr:penicillin-binding protein activator [Burkholderiales bacterium]
MPSVPRAATPAAARPVVVLLPLESAAFGRAAGHVKSGLTAAWSQSPNRALTELRFILVGDQPNDVIAGYNQAVAANARVIIGPLIRDQVSALASALAQSAPVNIPTLALNVVDGDPRLAANLFLFGLSTEAESRQVARLALREGYKRALVLTQPNAFSRRVQQAFVETFLDAGGSIAAQHAAVTDLNSLNRLRTVVTGANADMIFIAADLRTARTVRPFLDTQLPAFATSQLWSGQIDANSTLDLNGTRLIDMPWLLEPDHPAVMIYARSQPALTPENERLYALGIDAYRLAELAGERGLAPGLSLDGVTGRITIERGHWLIREPSVAQIWQGQLLPGNERK